MDIMCEILSKYEDVHLKLHISSHPKIALHPLLLVCYYIYLMMFFGNYNEGVVVYDLLYPNQLAKYCLLVFLEKMESYCKHYINLVDICTKK